MIQGVIAPPGPRNVGHPATLCMAEAGDPPCPGELHMLGATCCSSGVSPPAAHYHFAGGTMFHSPEFGQVQQLLVIVNQLSTTPMLLRVVPPGGLNCR